MTNDPMTNEIRGLVSELVIGYWTLVITPPGLRHWGNFAGSAGRTGRTGRTERDESS